MGRKGVMAAAANSVMQEAHNQDALKLFGGDPAVVEPPAAAPHAATVHRFARLATVTAMVTAVLLLLLLMQGAARGAAPGGLVRGAGGADSELAGGELAGGAGGELAGGELAGGALAAVKGGADEGAAITAAAANAAAPDLAAVAGPASAQSATSGEQFWGLTVPQVVGIPARVNLSAVQVRPNGVLCVFGSYGRSGNHLAAARGGIALALLSNRTFVAQKDISNAFDMELLANMAPGLVASYEQFHHLCPHQVSSRVETFCERIHGCGLLLKDPKYLPSFNNAAGRGSIMLPAVVLFRSSIVCLEIEGFMASFFRNLFFVPRIRSAAAAFIEKTFGDRDFAAVHLRDLEGSCKRRTNSRSPGAAQFVCDPHRTTFLRLMKEMTNLSVSLPIFVASDGQDKSALRSYVEAGDKIFTSECRGTDCAFIDFEIATHASFFMGTFASTVSSGLISQVRRYRRMHAGAHYFPSVLDYRETQASLLGKFALDLPGGRRWRVLSGEGPQSAFRIPGIP